MPLQVPCGQCGTQCTVPDSFAGRVIPCPYCRAPLQVPGRPPETAPQPMRPLLDILDEELASAGGTPAAGMAEPWTAPGRRARGKFRLPGPIAMLVAGAGALAFFVLLVALFPKVGLPVGWLVVSGGVCGLFAAVCWLLYELCFVPPHRRRPGTSMLGALGALGCVGIGVLGVWYASRELDRREHPWKYLAKAPAAQPAAPAPPQGPSGEKASTAVAAKPGGSAAEKPAGYPGAAPPAPGTPGAPEPPPAEDLVSFDPARFGKAPPGAKPVQGLPPPDPDASPIETAYEEASRVYAAEAAAELLAGDDASFREKMLWFALANRPVMGLRWAFGLQTRDAAAGPQATPAEDIEKQVKALSLAVVGGLDQRISARLFGPWPETGDPRFRQVAVLREGRRHELIAAAKRRAVDLLVIVDTSGPAGAPADKAAARVTIDLVDLVEDRSLATFPRQSGPGGPAIGVPASNVQSAARAEEFLKFVDENCALKPVPWSVVEQAKPRLARLASRPPHPYAGAALLLEVRYYLARQLVQASEAIAIYDTVLGTGQGEKFVSGDVAARRAVLESWIKGL